MFVRVLLTGYKLATFKDVKFLVPYSVRNGMECYCAHSLRRAVDTASPNGMKFALYLIRVMLK